MPLLYCIQGGNRGCYRSPWSKVPVASIRILRFVPTKSLVQILVTLCCAIRPRRGDRMLQLLSPPPPRPQQPLPCPPPSRDPMLQWLQASEYRWQASACLATGATGLHAATTCLKSLPQASCPFWLAQDRAVIRLRK